MFAAFWLHKIILVLKSHTTVSCILKGLTALSCLWWRWLTDSTMVRCISVTLLVVVGELVSDSASRLLAACQCNGHSKCVNSSVCERCGNLTAGTHCQSCMPGYYGDSINGGRCNGKVPGCGDCGDWGGGMWHFVCVDQTVTLSSKSSCQSAKCKQNASNWIQNLTSSSLY